VGFPSTALQEKKLPIHHTLADGDFESFMKMSERISAAAIQLKGPLEATKMIDETIVECYRSSKTVYIGFPMDVVKAEIDSFPLEKPLLLRPPSTSTTAREENAVRTIRERVFKA
jgi:pyruvate decarboxylase